MPFIISSSSENCILYVPQDLAVGMERQMLNA